MSVQDQFASWSLSGVAPTSRTGWVEPTSPSSGKERDSSSDVARSRVRKRSESTPHRPASSHGNGIQIPPLLPAPPVPPQHHKPALGRAQSSHDSRASSSHSNERGPPLGLGVQLHPPSVSDSTYRDSVYSASLLPSSPRSEDLENSQVETATRVSRGGSGSSGFATRKQSIATIVTVNPGRNGSASSTASAATSNLPFAFDSPTLRRPAPPLADGRDSRPIGYGTRASYSGSTQTSVPHKRSSSMYVKHSQAISPPHGAPLPTRTAFAAPEMPTVTLAMRTRHQAHLPGYEWRISLLEKLEKLLGTPLSAYELEEILAIGKGADGQANTRANSRKSLIVMPPSVPRGSRHPPKSPGSSRGSNGGGFFGSVLKRAFYSADFMGGSSTTPAKPQPKTKVVFGAPLGAVAAYGFCTSMIAGQEHDLPSVCFNTVEEIYRRGQGPKIVEFFFNAGDPNNVSKLVDIYNEGPDYGEGHDLSEDSIFDVISLLKKYLRDLPEPLLDSRLWRLFVHACVDSKAPQRRRVACAQILLRLLPTVNFSLMVYIIAFLSKVPHFPQNALPLESMAVIFGPSIMSPRTLGSGAKFQRQATGVPESEQSDVIGITAKKAQEGLLWLLVSWNDVADNLLEPTLDLDTDEILGHTAREQHFETIKPIPRVPSDLMAEQELLNSPNPSLSSHYDASPVLMSPSHTADFSPRWGVQDDSRESLVSAHFSHVNVAPESAPSQQDVAPWRQSQRETPSPAQVRHNRRESTVDQFDYHAAKAQYRSSSRGRGLPPPTRPPRQQQISLTDVELELDVEQRPRSLDRERSHSSELPMLESSRSSGESSGSARPDRGAVLSLLAVGGPPSFGKSQRPPQVGFARPRPEDEYGPLEPKVPTAASVLDELLLQGDDISQYMPELDHVEVIVPSSVPEARSSTTSLVRSPAEQLVESQQLQEMQRREIQLLWKQLTENELARASDRSELESVRKELAALKASTPLAADVTKMAQLEARCLKAEEETRNTFAKLSHTLEVKENESRVARLELHKVVGQLSAIRSVLGGGRS